MRIVQKYIERLEQTIPRPFWRMGRVIQSTFLHFERHEGPIRAAALAYYGLLSIFPLLLFLIFLGSQVLTSDVLRLNLSQNLTNALPGLAQEIEGVIDRTLSNRGPIGILSGIGLLWSASALFNNLQASLNVIWGANRRHAIRRRFFALLAVLSLGTLFVISPLIRAVPALPGIDENSPLWTILDLSLGLAIIVTFYFLINFWLPNLRVRRRAALGAAMLSTILQRLAQTGFAWYLESGFNNFGEVYGSLASVIGLVLWAYLNGFIIFIGAEFGAALQREFWPRVHG